MVVLDDGRARPAAPIRAGTVAEIEAPVDQRLDPQPRRERRHQHDPRVRDRPLIVIGGVTTAGPAEAGPGSVSCAGLRVESRALGSGGGYLIMIPASMSTWAHLVPVLHGFGLSVLFLPSTVTVTVCVPAARASRAQTTRRGWRVAE